MNFVTPKMVQKSTPEFRRTFLQHAPRLLTAAFTLAALAVSTGTSRAQTTAAAPAAVMPPVEMITPLQWLNRQPKPIYKPGHTIPRLTYYGTYRSINGFIEEITANWNYTLNFPYLNDETVKRAD